MRTIKKEQRRIEKLWLPYPENKPLPGWCATTDGGDIHLVFWSNGSWGEEDRGIVEFMQVTVNNAKLSRSEPASDRL